MNVRGTLALTATRKNAGEEGKYAVDSQMNSKMKLTVVVGHLDSVHIMRYALLSITATLARSADNHLGFPNMTHALQSDTKSPITICHERSQREPDQESTLRTSVIPVAHCI